MARPTGLLWRMTSGFTRRSRARRYELFVDLMRPMPDETILDVGIIDTTWRASNPLEANYEHLAQVTAVSLADAPTFKQVFPEVDVVIADGRDLPFGDSHFDIGFSNAVVEHVGNHKQQRAFVHELVRTCRRTMIATPNALFPIDPHTLLPFVHWLPRRLRHRLLRWSGNDRWASEEVLNPLTPRRFKSLFSSESRVRIVSQRTLGITTNLIAVVDRQETGPSSAEDPESGSGP